MAEEEEAQVELLVVENLGPEDELHELEPFYVFVRRSLSACCVDIDKV